MAERMIPILPCRSIGELADFYESLGFTAYQRQTRPNPYIALRRNGFELHFYGTKAHDPATAYNTCYVTTDDVDILYEAFRAGLKQSLGRIPLRGLPRIGPLKDMAYGVRQFLLTDPAGNCIRIGQPTGGSLDHPELPEERVAKALHLAVMLADSKEDVPAGARVLDRLLDGHPEQPVPPDSLYRALILRADYALRLGDPERAGALLAIAGTVELTGTQRIAVADDRDRAAELAEAARAEPAG
jgi:hypothetical protein